MKLSNETIIETAHKIGFDLVGFAKAEILDAEFGNLKEWLRRGYQAGMEYMGRNPEKRHDVSEILPGVKSVISLGLNYYTGEQYEDTPGSGKVSRYAWGRDYHLIIWEMLDKFTEQIKNINPNFEAQTYVDTGPVMDKAWAVRAGLGWLGKHTNVINKEYGSWFFIANVINNFEFKYSTPIEDFCGTCTACIDACPTHALVDEYVLDSNRCISYLTIENKKEIPDEFRKNFDGWLFGCDICQDVCPWNVKFSTDTLEAGFYPVNKQIEFDEIKGMTNSEFKKRFGSTPISRPRLKGLKRNAEYLRNSQK